MFTFFRRLYGFIHEPSLVAKRDSSPLTLVTQPQATSWSLASSEALLEFNAKPRIPGWYMVELRVDTSVHNVVSRLSIRSSGGLVEHVMPLRPGKVCKRLIYVPWNASCITFQPMGVPGDITIQQFRLLWVLPAFAWNRILVRLRSAHMVYRDKPLSAIKARLREDALALETGWRKLAWRRYETTFRSHHNYSDWVEEVEQPALPGQAEVKRRVGLLAQGPEFGVVMAISRADEAVRQTLESLAGQVYAGWRVALVVPGDEAAGVQSLLNSLGLSEGCALVPTQLTNKSVISWLQQAVNQLPSEAMLCLEPGDVLAPLALLRLAETLEDNPGCALVYADEDALDSSGARQHPWFKPAWNPDGMLSQPWLGRMLAIRSSVFGHGLQTECANQNTVPAIFQALGLSQLATVETEYARAMKHAVHVAEVLLHRASPVATGEQWQTIVASHLKQRGVTAEVSEGYRPGTVRVRWPLPKPEPLVSLLVPTRDGIDILKPCVDAILDRTTYRHFELLILDNQSRCADTLAYMRDVAERDSRVRVLRWDHPFNYSSINNFGAAQSRGSIIGLVNNDIEPIDSDWLTEMVSQVSRPGIGCVGAKLYYPNDTLQHGGVVLGLGGVAGHAHRFFHKDDEGFMGRLKTVHNLSAVTAACLLVEKSVFDEVGGLNEVDLPVAYNDVDLCLKVLKAGYRNLWTPYAELYHHESISRGADDTPAKRERANKEMAYMRATWAPLLDNDPAYNPNLTLVHEDFSLR